MALEKIFGADHHHWESRGMCLPDNTDEITELTPERAEALVRREDRDRLSLNSLKSLPLELALVLSQTKGNLFLNGLLSLSPEAAGALAIHRGDLHFDGLKDISPEVARALGKHYGNLSLNGLLKLPDEVAAALANCEMVDLAPYGEYDGDWFPLDYDVIEQYDPPPTPPVIGEGLPGLQKGELLDEMPEGQEQTRSLNLDGIKEISLLAASALSRNSGYVSLNGLQDLSEDIADTLSGIELSLNGLKKLRPSVASALAKCPEISLCGLTSLDPDDAVMFAKEKGESGVDLRGNAERMVHVAYSVLERWAGRESGHPTDFFSFNSDDLSLCRQARELGLGESLWRGVGKLYYLRRHLLGGGVDPEKLNDLLEEDDAEYGV